MFRLYCDGQLLYHDRLESLKLLNASVELERNKTGSLKFTLPHAHPYYSVPNRLKSIITLWQDDHQLFRGRILDEEVGFHNERAISCEGDLAFLLDSILRPFAFTGTPAEFLAYVLGLHNAQVDATKQFLPGNVTVEGYLTYDTEEYLTTKETLEKALSDPLGGYFQTRFMDGQAYLDYLVKPTLLSPQTIEFGKNLIDLKRFRKGADIATVIIPLGDKVKDEEGNDTGKRLTIASVNGGADFVQDEGAITQFGIIVKSVIFDGVTDPTELKAKSQAYLADSVKLPDTIELTAADLASVGISVTSFHVGTMVRVISKPHGIDQLFEVTKLTINLFNPASNKLTLGGIVEGFSGAVQGLANQQQQILQVIEKTAKTQSEAIYNTERNLLASLQVESDNIKSVVAETYTLKDDAEAMVSAVSTEVQQTKNSVEIQFSQFSADINSVAEGVDAEFEALHNYIRFEDGNIIQGGRESPFQKVQSATKESYYDSGAEVAYFSNKKLYVTDGEYTHSLRIGKLLVSPRSNGNTSINVVQ